MYSHASHPIAEQLQGSIFKIYFTCRDKNNKSSVGFLIIDIERPQEVLELGDYPVLSPGSPGYFDDSGTQASCLVKTPNGDSFLYYLAWNLSVSVPFRNSIGLAKRPASGGLFQKSSTAPIVDRDEIDPLTISYPWVLLTNDIWQMWYGSHLAWKTDQFEMIHVLRYAESNDGIHWKKNGKPVLELNLDMGEFAMSRPCVLLHEGLYRMWFSSRYNHYQMGYAESVDGIRWIRKDGDARLIHSESGWDAQSVEYASVFRYDDTLFMLYNGNEYGKTGFGIAVLDGPLA